MTHRSSPSFAIGGVNESVAEKIERLVAGMRPNVLVMRRDHYDQLKAAVHRK